MVYLTVDVLISCCSQSHWFLIIVINHCIKNINQVVMVNSEEKIDGSAPIAHNATTDTDCCRYDRRETMRNSEVEIKYVP